MVTMPSKKLQFWCQKRNPSASVTSIDVTSGIDTTILFLMVFIEHNTSLIIFKKISKSLFKSGYL